MKGSNNFNVWLGLISLLIIAYFPLFLHLDALPIRSFDEARPVAKAMEMIERGEVIVPYFAGEPDMWDIKPPLLIWLQSISVLSFGVNELAVRLPTALAGLGVVLFLYLFSAKYLASQWMGFFGALILISSHGFISLHVTRTGIYDGLLVFFTTLYGLFFFRFTENEKEGSFSPPLFLCGLAVTGAAMTKGIAGLLLFPGLLAYAIYRRKMISILKNPAFHTTLVVFILVVGGYYLSREALNPVFLATVNEQELVGRFFGVTQKDHKRPFFTYFNEMINGRFTPWLWLVPFLGLLSMREGGKEKRLIVYLFIVAISFILVISISESKLPWYNAQSLPFLSLICGMGFYRLITVLTQLHWRFISTNKNVTKAVLIGLITLGGIGPYYQDIVQKVYFPRAENTERYTIEEDSERYTVVRFLHYLSNNNERRHELNPLYVVYHGYKPFMEFYKRYFTEKGLAMEILKSDLRKETIHVLNKENKPCVVTCEKESKTFLNRHFVLDTIQNEDGCHIYKVFTKP